MRYSAAAFKRSTACRMRPLPRDHGINFVEASNQLEKEMQQEIEVASKKVADISGKKGITWKFIRGSLGGGGEITTKRKLFLDLKNL